MNDWNISDYLRAIILGLVACFALYHFLRTRKATIVRGSARAKNYTVRCHHQQFTPSHSIVKQLLAVQQGTKLIDARLIPCDPSFCPDSIAMRFVFQQQDKRSQERELVELLDIIIEQADEPQWKSWCSRNCKQSPFDHQSPAPYQLDWSQQQHLEREDKDRIPEGWKVGSPMAPYSSALK